MVSFLLYLVIQFTYFHRILTSTLQHEPPFTIFFTRHVFFFFVCWHELKPGETKALFPAVVLLAQKKKKPPTLSHAKIKKLIKEIKAVNRCLLPRAHKAFCLTAVPLYALRAQRRPTNPSVVRSLLVFHPTYLPTSTYFFPFSFFILTSPLHENIFLPSIVAFFFIQHLILLHRYFFALSPPNMASAEFMSFVERWRILREQNDTSEKLIEVCGAM